MAEILHFEILRKHGQTNKHTNKHTDMGITIPRPPPMGGEVIKGNPKQQKPELCFKFFLNYGVPCYGKTWTTLRFL